MPFMLYREQETPEAPTFEYVRNIQIAGTGGPLYRLVSQNASLNETSRSWHVTEREIIQAIDESAGNHALIIDLKPRVRKNVSLYRLRDVWGYSHDEWSPLALRLEGIFVDHQTDDPVQFKQRFVQPSGRPDHVGEFLYIQGGLTGGSWNWGMVGRVNGALMWPDALEYLSSSLVASLRASA